MASTYVEISVKEELSAFCESRSHPFIKEFVKTTVSRENSLGCSKIEAILGKFDKRIWDVLKDSLTEEEVSSIDSLKALRDQIAHGKDNNTGLFGCCVIQEIYGARKKTLVVQAYLDDLHP